MFEVHEDMIFSFVNVDTRLFKVKVSVTEYTGPAWRMQVGSTSCERFVATVPYYVSTKYWVLTLVHRSAKFMRPLQHGTGT